MLTAYVAFMEKLQFHNAVAGALGRSHRRDAGIPQGCPLSMMFIAFLMRPWVQSMLTLGAMPRVPADDLLVYALGEDHERVFREACDATHDYLQHLGAHMAHCTSAVAGAIAPSCKQASNAITTAVGQRPRP